MMLLGWGAGCALGPDAAALARARTPAGMAEMLPETVAGFRRTAILPGAADPADRSLAYSTEGQRTAAAMVDLSRPSGPEAAAGPDGPDPPAAAAALEAMLARAASPGGARRVSETARLTLPEGGPEGGPAGRPEGGDAPPALRCAETAGRYGRVRVQGLLCAGVLRGTLIRIRVTMPEADPPAADARAFARGVVAALRAPAAPSGA